MQVMLISDPTCDYAAAAIDVGVGSASDPDAFPGLAHFLEHMLFLGTQKYPKEVGAPAATAAATQRAVEMMACCMVW